MATTISTMGHVIFLNVPTKLPAHDPCQAPAAFGTTTFCSDKDTRFALLLFGREKPWSFHHGMTTIFLVKPMGTTGIPDFPWG